MASSGLLHFPLQTYFVYLNPPTPSMAPKYIQENLIHALNTYIQIFQLWFHSQIIPI